jgi:hypothetical protein
MRRAESGNHRQECRCHARIDPLPRGRALETIINRVSQTTAGGALEVNAIKSSGVDFSKDIEQATCGSVQITARIEEKYIPAHHIGRPRQKNPSFARAAARDCRVGESRVQNRWSTRTVVTFQQAWRDGGNVLSLPVRRF